MHCQSRRTQCAHRGSSPEQRTFMFRHGWQARFALRLGGGKVADCWSLARNEQAKCSRRQLPHAGKSPSHLTCTRISQSHQMPHHRGRTYLPCAPGIASTPCLLAWPCSRGDIQLTPGVGRGRGFVCGGKRVEWSGVGRRRRRSDGGRQSVPPRAGSWACRHQSSHNNNNNNDNDNDSLPGTRHPCLKWQAQTGSNHVRIWGALPNTSSRDSPLLSPDAHLVACAIPTSLASPYSPWPLPVISAQSCSSH